MPQIIIYLIQIKLLPVIYFQNLMKKVIFSISNPPTKEYILTRHNVGRLFIDNFLVKKINCIKTNSDKYTKYQFKSHPNLIVCTSQTFMNLSGKSVESFISKHRNLFVNQTSSKEKKSTEPDTTRILSLKQIAKGNILIIHDDMEHKFGNVRIKQKGSAQGHNGISSIISSMKTDDFKRLQIGIGRPESRDPQIVANYVLSNFSSKQRQSLEQIFSKTFQVLKKQNYI